jgi:amino acid transporter
MGFHATWAMAVGGMLGGGIYTLAGVVLGFGGPLAWISLLLGGLLAVATAQSYSRLTIELGDGAAPIDVLLREGRRHTAGLLSWGLLVVYVLALAVYTFTFSSYVGGALGVSPALAALAIMGALVAVNLLGIRQPAGVQIVAVWVAVAVLAGLAAVGLWRFRPENLVTGVPAGSLAGVVAGAAATFIAFEGFELLAYDVDEIRDPRRTLRSSLPWAVVAVAVAYAVVTLGAASLVGAGALIEHKDAALAYAAHQGLGTPGLVLVTIAAAASAASAINATLFSAARLLRTAAGRGLLPAALVRSNRRGSPVPAIVGLGVLGAGVAVAMSLDALVQVASFGFLVLFAVVNGIAAARLRGRRWLSLAGTLGTAAAAAVVLAELAREHPYELVWFVAALALAGVAHFLFHGRRPARGKQALAGGARLV